MCRRRSTVGLRTERLQGSGHLIGHLVGVAVPGDTPPSEEVFEGEALHLCDAPGLGGRQQALPHQVHRELVAQLLFGAGARHLERINDIARNADGDGVHFKDPISVEHARNVRCERLDPAVTPALYPSVDTRREPRHPMENFARSAQAATISIHPVRAILAKASMHGVSEDSLRKRYDLAPEMLADIDARVPALLVARMWDEVSVLCGRENFGLELGELAGRLRTLPTHLIDASENLGDGIRRVMAYYRVFNDVHPMFFEATPADARIWLDVKGAPIPMPRHAIEYAFAMMIELARVSTGAPVNARRVLFAHPAPSDTREHARVFGCVPTFGAARYEFGLDPEVLKIPHKNPDPELLEVLERHARELHERLPRTSEFSARVRAALIPLLSRSDVSVERVAKALKLSARTVQRYLQEESTSFQAVLDDLRKEVSIERLKGAEASIAEVAFSVGFSDQSAFHRAFVRWTGKTPGQFRRGG